jgi:hypothetical protein
MNKNTISFLLATLAIFTLSTYSQQPNYDNLNSVVQTPPSYNPSQNPLIKYDVTAGGFENFNLGVDFGEANIATNPRDPLNSMCAFNINNFHYTVNGYGWVRNNVIFPGYGVVGDPVVCFDSLGTAYYMTLFQNGPTYGIIITKSTNKGVTWLGANLVNSTTAGVEDKEWVVADQTAGPYSNYLYAGWRQFGGSNMRFVRSTDGGTTWSSPLLISGQQGAYVAVGPNGNIQGGSVYFACILGGIAVCLSTDGGQTFGSQYTAASPSGPGVICYNRYTVKNCIRTDPFPRMAVDNSFTSTRGNVYITYADNPPGPDNADIFLVRSTDYGVTWSNPIRVNDDNTTTDQWMPSISVDKNGKIFETWYDSRVDPANNLLTQLYGAVSTNGGLSFGPNFAISDVPFNPNSMAVGQGQNQANYIGDYIGNSAINGVGYAVWMDGRNNSLGSFTGFFPDFAMTANPTSANLRNNDSAFITIKIPSTRGTLPSAIKFTGSLDSLPQSGTISLSFVNGKDSISTFPDSVVIRVKTIGTVTPRLYLLTVKGNGINGTPVHVRNVNLLVNVSYLTIGTNRNNICAFKVNGVQYNSLQQLVFTNGSTVSVQAISPHIVGATRYVYTNWSDNGDTTHNVTINSNTNLTAFYKVQYHLIVLSSVGNAFGDNFYDSASNATFYVAGKYVNYQGTWYQFKGWAGNGPGSYTSPDSTGNDTAHTVQLLNAITETARWMVPIGIKKIGTEVPSVYKLYQNYPNPFNPSTTINFDIIKSGNVSITLYDILGKEITTLVNEKVEPGTFKVTFNADNFASGVYFYRIKTAEFTDVKKMLIIK